MTPEENRFSQFAEKVWRANIDKREFVSQLTMERTGLIPEEASHILSLPFATRLLSNLQKLSFIAGSIATIYALQTEVITSPSNPQPPQPARPARPEPIKLARTNEEVKRAIQVYTTCHLGAKFRSDPVYTEVTAEALEVLNWILGEPGGAEIQLLIDEANAVDRKMASARSN